MPSFLNHVAGDRRFVYLLIYSCGDERYPKRKIIFEINSFWDMMHDATKITENFSVAFSWRLSQGCRLSIYGGFRHFWRTLVLICLEIQLNSRLHYTALSWEISSIQNLFFPNSMQKFSLFGMFLHLTGNFDWIFNIMKSLRKPRIKVKPPLEVTDLQSGKLIHFFFSIIRFFKKT